MEKNVAGKWVVFAYGLPDHANPGEAITGGAANITANIRIDGGAANAVDDTNPTELEDGYYIFDITAVEANGDNLLLAPASSTANVQVIAVPGAVWTRPVGFNAGARVTYWNGVALGTTNPLPPVAAEAVGGLFTRGTGAGQINQSVNGQIDTNIQRLNNVAQSLLDLVDFVDAGYDPSTNKVQGVVLVDTTASNTDMRGTDNAALASVLGALADAAAAGDPTSADTLMQYIKQLINTLEGTVGVPVFPAESAPANDVSMIEVLRAIANDVTGLAGAAMRGTDGANTVVPLNASQTESEVNDALVALGLDHLINVAVIGTDVTDNSIIAKLVSLAATADWDTFDNASDSLQAIRDRGDTSWITGAGGGITDILNIQALIPASIDLADTASFRLGLMLINSLDDLPSTAEIDPGTISIERKAIGGTSWSAIVTDVACSEVAGLIYYDEVFNSGTGYVEGDSLRITLKSQKITVAANDYEISNATGRIFYSAIRQTMRGTNGANTTVPDNAGIAGIQNDLDNATDGLGAIKGVVDSRMAEASISTTGGAIDTVTNLTNLPAITANWLTAVGIAAGALDGKGNWNIGKTGYSLASTGLDAIVSTATGMVEIAKAIMDRVLTAGTHNILYSLGRRIRAIHEYGGYEGGKIWIDTINGTAGTEDDENGTRMFPVNTIADANTLSTSTGINRFELAPNSNIAFAVSQVNQIFFGHGWTLALGVQNISGSHFFSAAITGIASGTSEIDMHNCHLGTSTIPPAHLYGTSLDGLITLLAGDYLLTDCYAEDSNGTPPALDFSTAVDTGISLVRYSGSIELQNYNTTGTDTLVIDGRGVITINANCAGGTIRVSGHFEVVDNAAGAVTVVYDSINTNVNALPALIDDLAIKKNTALSNFPFLMVLTSDHVTPATGLTVTGQRRLDNGTFVAVSGAIAEVSNGIYEFDAVAADTNGDIGVWRFSAATADDVFVPFKTVQ